MRRLALPLIALVLVVGVLGIQVAHGGGSFEPLEPADPCQPRTVTSESEGFDALTERLTSMLAERDRLASSLESSNKEAAARAGDLQKEIERQQAIIARYRMFNREKSIRAAESRQKRLDKIERLERPTEENHVRFSFDIRRRMGEDAIEIKGLSKAFDGRPVFENISFI